MEQSRAFVLKRIVLALTLVVALFSRSQSSSPEHDAKSWRGVWIATAGQRTLRGSWWATGDDTWQPWILNKAYKANFPTSAAKPGKNMAWTDWTHGS